MPPAVIPAAKRTYAEAAATPALERATHVCVQRGGVVEPLGDNYVGPYLVLKKGPKVFKLQLGERTEVVSGDWLKPTKGKCRLWLQSLLAGGGPQGATQDHMNNFTRSEGSCVTGPCKIPVLYILFILVGGKNLPIVFFMKMCLSRKYTSVYCEPSISSSKSYRDLAKLIRFLTDPTLKHC